MTQANDLHSFLSDRFPRQADAESDGTTVTWLAHQGVMSVRGADPRKFLQGQVTCDLDKVTADVSTLGARCNPKGRMQSSFRLLNSGEDEFLLCMNRELVSSQVSELSKYAVFFKTALTDATADWVGLGLWGPDAQEALRTANLAVPGRSNEVAHTGRTLVVRLAEDAFEIWLSAAEAQPTLDSLCQSATPAATEAWQVRQIRAGIGEVTQSTYESFIPQMLNLQQLGGVSFRKGCYTGQEIVARMQYLGKLKRRMYRLLLAGDAPPPPGTPIVDRDNGKLLGEVVVAARSNHIVEMLAVLQKDAAQLTTMSVADSGGPLLTMADLPYESELIASEAEREN
ncbi:CAF17-like 4Fe-4S cluster assembly/insertion protein YgfZ [Pseudomonas profundi]|uniref:CAF17-like 4Fe-4S cluster assembly/insertion protein YgfZ n=1 Tax=Pseudomonas profundi TaxID=1981513 RepID=UPI00123C73A5|nr:folate-binding protein YgfZ [Pseudomonas profundi]